MKSRTRQRENRKLKKSQRKPWLNHEGYYDPTAYHAIRNIERSESDTRKRGIRKPALQTT